MRYKLFAALLFVSLQAFSQVDANRFTNIVESVSSGSAAYGSGFKGRFNLDGRIKGTPYLDTNFVQTNFQFVKGSSKLVAPSRYDLYRNEIEVQTTGGIRVLANNLVKSYKSFVDGDSVLYINASNYTFEGTQLIGFLKVISDGKAQLFEMYKLDIIKPTYNASLEVGDRNSHLVKRSSLMYSDGKDLFKLKGKKELLQLFASQKEKMEAYIKTSKPDLKDQEDLKKVFDYYNSLN
jgi:hypothetical protein